MILKFSKIIFPLAPKKREIILFWLSPFHQFGFRQLSPAANNCAHRAIFKEKNIKYF